MGFLQVLFLVEQLALCFAFLRRGQALEWTSFGRLRVGSGVRQLAVVGGGTLRTTGV